MVIPSHNEALIEHLFNRRSECLPITDGGANHDAAYKEGTYKRQTINRSKPTETTEGIGKKIASMKKKYRTDEDTKREKRG